MKRLPVFLIVLAMILFSCQNGQVKQTGISEMPPETVKKTDPGYAEIIRAFERLQNDPDLQNATLGYMVVDVTNNDTMTVAGFHAEDLMIPASTLKLFVTGAALELFGHEVVQEVMITNQMSVNWRSSKLLRRIGKKVYHTATTDAGARAVRDFWYAKGVDTTGMYFYDGNGLSHSNAISPKQLVDALYVMLSSPYSRVFYESLPLAGLTGTLHRAMKGSIAEGRVRAKTGTIGKVKSFAGYVTTLNGRRLIFSLIVNNYECRVKVVKKKLEEVMISMAAV